MMSLIVIPSIVIASILFPTIIIGIIVYRGSPFGMRDTGSPHSLSGKTPPGFLFAKSLLRENRVKTVGPGLGRKYGNLARGN